MLSSCADQEGLSDEKEVRSDQAETNMILFSIILVP